MMNTILLVVSAVTTLLFAIVLFYACFNKEEHIMIITYQTNDSIGYKSLGFNKADKIETYNRLVDEIKKENPDNIVIITNVSTI